ncbi:MULTISPECIES: tripartite tricarboxylate transporter permease [unclassified Uliginosibacterium]|jgi:putative tricarboxylic transport membrane protein|uniref:tripartite tricarboxylate transporter permease n=1 Tax=unclassified Uliginosibacterium TaxID=2621521 RepID=UPI000C7AC8CA|nr:MULTISPECIES: tripartite tricarboxylate transporter permease [unclassified Uliginosibacterium]MDO6386013.1 tripartite tricarboxylate transporter permease [Uliginosibacterium sp. 31-12]PLK50020.1 tripartite tricarboxylate transporter TctA [Uliginosibacterium sp. TH139]
MESLNALFSVGFATALSLSNLLWALLGCSLGTAIGVLPGIGPAATVALLLPLTAGVEPTGALIMLAGVYYGAMFGGSTTSILLNTPGEAGSIISALEGNKMAHAGRGGAALSTAAIGSFVAGTIATVLLTLLAPVVADLALKLGPAENFAIMVLAFVAVSAVVGDMPEKGFVALFIGLALGMIGIEEQSGQARFTFGILELTDGIDIVVVAMGLFAVGETLYTATYENRIKSKLERITGSIWMSAGDWRRSWKPWLRGTLIGFPFGTIPAGGTEMPTFLSYSTEKKLASHPEEFGKGAIEGVAGPEAANNAAATGTLVPLLTLGIPTSATAAIMLSAFQQYNITPGPLLFDTNPELVWGLIASLYIGNVMLLVLNLPLVGIWVQLLRIPRPLLYGGIVVLATLGAYSLRQSWFDLLLLYMVGVLGFAMKRFEIPVVPLIVGLILGPMAEKHFRRAMTISQGDITTFFTRPGSLTILIIAGLLLVLPPLLKQWRALRRG